MNIWQIEITNDCNFSCNYCPRTLKMKRPIGTMSYATIDRIANICTSEWIRLHQFGESLLKPDVCEYAIRKFKQHGIKVGINTNGSAANLKNVKRVFDAGLDEMVLSWHPTELREFDKDKKVKSNKHYQTLIDNLPAEYLSKMEIIRVVDMKNTQAQLNVIDALMPYAKQNIKCSLKTKRNLGRVNGEPDPNAPMPSYCSFLEEPELAVLWDGTIVSCCEVYDINIGGVFGNVHDANLPVKNTGCSMCPGCPGYGGNNTETEKTINVTGDMNVKKVLNIL